MYVTTLEPYILKIYILLHSTAIQQAIVCGRIDGFYAPLRGKWLIILTRSRNCLPFVSTCVHMRCFWWDPYVFLLRVFTFWVPCCDVRYDFRIKTMFSSSFPQVVCRRVHVLLMFFVFACLSGVQHISCCVFVLFVCVVYTMLPVPLDCHVLFALLYSLTFIYFTDVRMAVKLLDCVRYLYNTTEVNLLLHLLHESFAVALLNWGKLAVTLRY